MSYFGFETFEERTERLYLRDLLLRSTNPMDIPILCWNIGFPCEILHKINHLFPGQCMRVIEMMFDLWYPYAQRLLKMDDLSARDILAYAYHKLGKNVTAATLLKRENVGHCLDDKRQKRLFRTVVVQLTSQITNSVDPYCYRTSASRDIC